MAIARKFVLVADTTTHTDIGCSRSHFDTHIRDKQLTVTTEFQTLVVVNDGSGQQWTILKSLLKGYQWKKDFTHV
ncbi:MAG TPA: hypothetical protein VGK59_23875 [Ohtaekwangia sp.]